MTLAGPLAQTTLAAVAAGAAALVVLAYILKMRRRRFEVPFSKLWQRVLREQETTSLWNRLRRLLSLLLQLVLFALLFGAVADPRLGGVPAGARDVVLILDASASMKARDEGDGSQTRLEAAKRRAHELVAAMGGGDSAMVLRMDGQATPLSRFESDLPLLHRVIDSVEASDAPADLRGALAAAADALRDRKNPLVILVGDGAYPPDPGLREAPVEGAARTPSALDLTGIDLRFVPVGKRADNVGIVAFNVRRYIANKSSYEVFLEVENAGPNPAQAKLTLFAGDAPVEVRDLSLAPGEKVRQIYPNLGGGDDHRLRAALEVAGGADVFALDDVAYALLPERKRQHVLLVTGDNLYLEGAMLAYDNIEIDKLTPADYEAAVGKPDFPAYDAVVFDAVAPVTVPPSSHLVYFDPSGPASPFPVTGALERPRITDAAEHPVMRWVALSDVNFDRASVFGIDRDKGDVALAVSIRSPIIAAGRRDGRKVVAFGFDLGATDLMLRVAFPLLLVNSLDWFAGDDSDLITTFTTGRRFRVRIDGAEGLDEVEVRGPGGVSRAPLVDGHATFFGNRVGFHTLVAAADGQVVAQAELAANLSSPDESRIAPVAELVVAGRPLPAPDGFAVSRRRAIWLYLALAALGLLALEWVSYHRRWTV